MGVAETSGVRSMPLSDVVVQRRRQIAWRGYEAGRWCYSMALAADELASRPDMPLTDDGWSTLLDDLEAAMASAVLRVCERVYDQKDSAG